MPQEVPDRSGNPLRTRCDEVRHIGPERAKLLAKIGLFTVGDLLFHLPRELHDLGDIRSIGDLDTSQVQSVTGVVLDVDARTARNGKKLITVLIDCRGERLRATWFNQLWMLRRFEEGQIVAFSGKPKLRYGQWEMSHPKTQWLGEEETAFDLGLECVYPLTDGIRMVEMRELVQKTVEEYADWVPELLPDGYREQHDLPRINEALFLVHLPGSRDDFERGRRRIVYDDLFEFQLGLAMRRQAWRETGEAPKLKGSPKIDARIRRLFPFRFTGGQDRAIAEIREDIASPFAMHRLLQADVGAGKTVVALYAILTAIANGYQAVLMAPTEVLANQHWRTVEDALHESRVNRCLLTGQLTPKQRREAHERIADGRADLIIGTQAVIQESVTFRRLGLVVIDEQHKFGVLQRARFSSTEALTPGETTAQPTLFDGRPKTDRDASPALTPHILVMTATPIPRSLCLTQFGDLDVSIISELPPGRQPVVTARVSDAQTERRAWNFVRKQIESGRQAYVVCPRVEEDDTSGMLSAEGVFEDLQSGELEGLSIGMVHGKLDRDEKARVMDAFRSGSLSVLVSTTVIEVGVDVPNATMMIILQATHFGLSQLHQLRGRIGRGSFQGYCFLFATEATADGAERLLAMERTSDGFQIAEADFELRGPGDVLGTRQHGQLPLRVADLNRDAALLRTARRDAFQLLKTGELNAPAFAELRTLVQHRFGDLMLLPNTG